MSQETVCSTVFFQVSDSAMVPQWSWMQSGVSSGFRVGSVSSQSPGCWT